MNEFTSPFCSSAPSSLHGSSQSAAFQGSYSSSMGPCLPAATLPTQHTQQPIVTGTSVLAIKYKDGIMMTADTLGSYGSLARFRDERRLMQVGDYTVLGSGGDISDFQSMQHQLNQLLIEDYYVEDGHRLAPENIYEYLSRVMYQRRSKMNPLWNTFVVGGFRNGEKFLGCVDLRGTTWQSDSIATGFGGYLAQPLLRKAMDQHGDQMSEQQAIKLLDDCMRVLFYRDARSLNRFQRAKVTAQGIEITEPYSVDTEWGFAEHIRGYGV